MSNVILFSGALVSTNVYIFSTATAKSERVALAEIATVSKAFEVIDMKTFLIQRTVNADEINQEVAMRLDGIEIVNRAQNLPLIGYQHAADPFANFAQESNVGTRTGIEAKDYLQVVMSQIFVVIETSNYSHLIDRVQWIYANAKDAAVVRFVWVAHVSAHILKRTQSSVFKLEQGHDAAPSLQIVIEMIQLIDASGKDFSQLVGRNIVASFNLIQGAIQLIHGANNFGASFNDMNRFVVGRVQNVLRDIHAETFGFGFIAFFVGLRNANGNPRIQKSEQRRGYPFIVTHFFVDF